MHRPIDNPNYIIDDSNDLELPHIRNITVDMQMNNDISVINFSANAVTECTPGQAVALNELSAFESHQKSAYVQGLKLKDTTPHSPLPSNQNVNDSVTIESYESSSLRFGWIHRAVFFRFTGKPTDWWPYRARFKKRITL